MEASATGHKGSAGFVLTIAAVTIVILGSVICEPEPEPANINHTVESPLLAGILDDINSLKAQMTQKSFHLDMLWRRVSTLENATSQLEYDKELLNGKMAAMQTKTASLEGLISKLEGTDLTMVTKNLTGLTGELATVESTLKELEGTAGKLTYSVNGLSGTMRSQNATLRHLHNVNQIWRGNFKVVNATFRHIRKKVEFPVPAFSGVNNHNR